MVLTKQLIKSFTTSEEKNCMRGFFTLEANWGSLRSEILAPSSCIQHDTNGYYMEFEKTDALTEVNLFILVTTIGILLILLGISWRSCNPFRMDWFRLIFLYIFGTLGVIVVVQGGPSTPGFNRFLGFGILVHNFAEAYLLKHIWFGSKGLASFTGVGCAILYLWIMSTFIWLLPIDPFFFIAMWQGASFDYFLLYTLPYAAYHLRNNRWNYISWILASIAAAIHITSIQPLFFGMSLAYATISSVTSVFLFPTFFFYTFFAIRELGRVSFIGPSFENVLEHATSKKDDDKKEIAIIPQDKEIFKNLKTVDLKVSYALAEQGILRYFNLDMKVFYFTVIGAMVTSAANSAIVFWAPCYIHVACHK